MSFMNSKNIPKEFKGIVEKKEKKYLFSPYKYSWFNVLHIIAFVFFHDLNGRHLRFVSNVHLSIHSFLDTCIECLLCAGLCSRY